MSHNIYITKTMRDSFSPKKIKSEDFEKMIDDDVEFDWLENSPIIEDNIKKQYAPRQVAIWQFGDDYLWIELSELGTIDFDYRPQVDPELDIAFSKICAMAYRLHCFVEAEGGELLYDPAEDH